MLSKKLNSFCIFFLVFIFACMPTIFAQDNSALPRAVACGNCHSGTLSRVRTEEFMTQTMPCLHGYPNGNDTNVGTFDCYYDQCNSCGFRFLISATKIRETGWVCVGTPKAISNLKTPNSVSIASPQIVALTQAFAPPFYQSIAPRAVACGNCHSGALFEKYVIEPSTVSIPCSHGFPNGQDDVEMLFRLHVEQCNYCHFRIVHSMESTGQTANVKCYGFR